MSLFDASDIAELRALAAQGHTMELTLRRGSTSLPGQAGIIVSRGTAAWNRTPAAKASRTDALLIGAHDLDAQQGDRLTAEGAIYEVSLIHPDREVETICDLVVSQ